MKKVLIVDDATFMRISLKAILEENGFEVVGEAENGIKGISNYKKLKPDIVTLDITMPGMDGMEALKEILKFDPMAKAVMITALGQEAYVKKSISLGAKGFLIKPYREEYLIKTLSKL